MYQTSRAMFWERTASFWVTLPTSSRHQGGRAACSTRWAMRRPRSWSTPWEISSTARGQSLENFTTTIIRCIEMGEGNRGSASSPSHQQDPAGRQRPTRLYHRLTSSQGRARQHPHDALKRKDEKTPRTGERRTRLTARQISSWMSSRRGRASN